MILINEWLPNPVGEDAKGEWIELLNSGLDSIELSGWRVSNGKTEYTLPAGRVLGAGGYAVLARPATKLVLHNTGGALVLSDPLGREMDRASFMVTAPEGKSYSRAESGIFFFGLPTPGAANALPQAALLHSRYDNLPRLPEGALYPITFALGFGVLVAALIVAVIKSDAYLSKFLFARDETVR